MVDAQFQNAKKPFAIKRHALDLSILVQKSLRSNTQHNPYPLVRYENQVAVSPDGKRIYVSMPEPFKIHVLDGGNFQTLRIIERDEPQLEFDKSLVQMEMQQIQPSRSAKNTKVQVPEYFPVIQGIACSVEGYVIVTMWSRQSKTGMRDLLLDEFGREANLPYQMRYLRQILAIQGDHAWLCLWNREEDVYQLVKCEIGQIDVLAGKYGSETQEPQ